MGPQRGRDDHDMSGSPRRMRNLHLRKPMKIWTFWGIPTYREPPFAVPRATGVDSPISGHVFSVSPKIKGEHEGGSSTKVVLGEIR